MTFDSSRNRSRTFNHPALSFRPLAPEYVLTGVRSIAASILELSPKVIDSLRDFLKTHVVNFRLALFHI